MMSGIDSRHCKISTGLHFQNGHHNTTKNVASILKIATSRNVSLSEINSGHHYLPTHQILMISDNVEFLRYCGGHFENGDRSKSYFEGFKGGGGYYRILWES
jgi:hypothetical protein